MNHGSLFSGIGGFDLAARWVGWNNLFHVEQDQFCRDVLRHHFPNSHSHDNIQTFDAAQFRGRTQIISGGFPCQPFSAAGKRAGTSDDRYLWPEMLRVIRDVRPLYVLAENVRGLINWNEGLVFDTVCADLENEGFEVAPFVLPAASVNAPHRRERLFVVAYADGNRLFQSRSDERGTTRPGQTTPERVADRGHSAHRYSSDPRPAAYADGEFVEHRHDEGTAEKQTVEEIGPESPDRATCWTEFPSERPVCRGNDGFPHRLDDITFPQWRRQSIKAFGNAVVPQLAVQLFRVIAEMEANHASPHK